MIWLWIPLVLAMLFFGIVLLARHLLFRLYTRPLRIKAKGSPRDFGLAYEELSITANGHRHPGWLMHPRSWNGMAPLPLVLVMHGFAAEKSDILPRCAALTEAGFLTATFDWRAHGDHESELFSGGVVERHDLAAIIEHFAGKPWVADIGLYGFSYAAAAAIVVAADKADVSCVAADSPFDTLSNAMRAVLTRYPLGGRLILPGMEKRFISMFNAPISEMDVTDAAPRISPRPLLVLTGSNDRIVPSKMAQRVYTAAREPKKLLVQKGGSHFDNATPALLKEQIVPFFSEHLAGGRGTEIDP